MLKICIKCHIPQTLDCFSKDERAKDGYQHRCKNCQKKYHEQWRKQNKELIILKQKRWYDENKSVVSVQKKQYHIDNKLKISQCKARHYAKNKQTIGIKQRAYQKTPIGKAVAINTTNKRRSITKQGDVTPAQLLQLTQNATHCFWCSIPLVNIKVHIDHFEPLSRGGHHTISNLVVACSTCNTSKGAKDPFEFAKLISEKYDTISASRFL